MARSSGGWLPGGYAVLRFTHADLARRSSQVARQIRLALAER